MNEKLKAKGMPMVEWLPSLFQAAVVQECVHVVFQGTRRCLLWKGKAGPRRWGNHRGMELSRQILSVMFGVIKRRTDEQIENFLADVPCRQQVGRNIICDALHTSIRAIPSWHGHDACTVFAELEKAHDMIPRELATCCHCAESVLANKMVSLGLQKTLSLAGAKVC